MADSKDMVCEPCQQNNLTIAADVWCNDCGEGYCNECVKFHKVFKTTRNHHRISIKNYRITNCLNRSESCPEHGKMLAFFCVKHDAILCLGCFQSKHSKCEIVDLAEASKGSKISAFMVNFEKEIFSLIKQLNEHKGIDNINLSCLENQKLGILSEVNEVRSKLNEHLDKLQNKIMKELEEKFENIRTEIENRKGKVEHVENSLKEIVHQISLLKEFASEKQTFIAIRQKIETFPKEKESADVALSDSEGTQLSHVSLNVDRNVQSLLGLKSLGEIRTERTCRVTTSWESRTSLKVQPFADISCIQLTFNKTIEIGNDSKNISFSGCVLMPNKKMVFVDNIGKRLIIHNGDGKHRFNFLLSGQPFDAIATSKNHVAVTIPDEKIIAIINIEDCSRECSIACKFSCWGLCTADDKLYVNDANNKQVHVMDMFGADLEQIYFGVAGMYNITIFKDRVYLIGMDSKKLYAFDKNQNKLWEFNDKRLCKPQCFRGNFSTSLTTDNHGNIFTVLPDSHTVFVVSHDGGSTRDILNTSNNHYNPSGVSYLNDTNQLLVCNALHRYAALYDVKHSPLID